jgi:hypothetical protein
MSAPNLNDLHTQSGGLHALLWMLYEASCDLDYASDNAPAVAAANRVSHLIILARDEAERLGTNIGACITTQKREQLARKPAAVSPIMALFEQWNSLRDHSDQPGLDDDELDRRCAQTDAVMKQIGQLPATSAADFAAKLSCITHYGAYSNLGGDCGGLGSALICEAAALCGQAEKVSRVPTDHQARGQRNG